ncbi:MAG: hypothetical protein AABZ06_12740, partial [Bdellovibrionota bacterium]
MRHKIALLTIFILLSPGCRMGNRVEQAVNENPDTTSGYYKSLPQTLKFCATHATTKCSNLGSNHIPEIISKVMSYPVALVVKELETGKAYLASVFESGGALPVFVTKDLSLSYLGSTPPETLWT